MDPVNPTQVFAKCYQGLAYGFCQVTQPTGTVVVSGPGILPNLSTATSVVSQGAAMNLTH